MSHNRGNEIESDEALARILQMQEQTHRVDDRSALRSRSRSSAQELEDLELARQFAEMDMNDTQPSVATYQHKSMSSIDFNWNRETPHATSRNDYDLAALPWDNGHSRASHSASSLENHLNYARRLQEQAFSSLAGQTVASDPSKQSVPLAALPTATRPFVGTSRQETRDERLARFMEESGASFSNLSTGFLNDLMEPAEHANQNAKNNSDSNGGQRHHLRAQARSASLTPIPQPASSQTAGVSLEAFLLSPHEPNFQTSRNVGIHSAPTTPAHKPQASKVDLSESMRVPILDASDVNFDIPLPARKDPKKKGRLTNFLAFGGKRNGEEFKSPISNTSWDLPPGIPPMAPDNSIPESVPPFADSKGFPSPTRRLSTGAIPMQMSPRRQSLNNSGHIGQHARAAFAKPPPLHTAPATNRGTSSICAVCGKHQGPFLAALDKRYHPECFRCFTCHERIDSAVPFKISVDKSGIKRPHHPMCFAASHGINCTVCSKTIPASVDGSVTYVKHPFFESQTMCLQHAESPGRRCAGCQRFEPQSSPFADLQDGRRCVCYACCRTVMVDSYDAKPLWKLVLIFFEKKLRLTIWPAMSDIPVLLIGLDALVEQMAVSKSPHFGAPHPLCSSVTLMEQEHGKRFKLPLLRFDQSTSSFASLDRDEQGFFYYDLPNKSSSSKDNFSAVLCLLGLPRDLTASILAHEATHLWMKLHPEYDPQNPIPPLVEEGCAQLVAMLLLRECDNLEARVPQSEQDGPSNAKLRQYFKFCIERDSPDNFSRGYRLALKAFADIGIDALLNHVVRYKEFPQT